VSWRVIPKALRIMMQTLRNLPIRIKISSISSLVLLLISSFVFIYFPVKQKEQVTSALRSKAESTAQILSLGVSIALGEGNYGFIDQVFILAKRDPNILYIAILDEDGNRIISYNPQDLQIPSKSSSANRKAFEERGMLHAAVPLQVEEGVEGNLIVGFSLRDRDKAIAQIRVGGLGISIVIFLLGISLSFYLSRLITNPLQKVVDTIGQIERTGDYQHTIEKNSTDEIGTLIDALNHMSATIQTRTQELQQSESQMDAVLNTIGEGIISVDETLTIVLVNQEVLTIWGFERDELIGKKLQMLIAERHREILAAGLKRDLKAGAFPALEQRLEIEGLREDGSVFPLEIQISETRIGERLLFTAALRDISERKQMEYERVRTQRQRAMGDLSAGVSHNLNNILTGILLPADLLTSRINDPELLKDAEIILASAIRARDLINRLHLSTRGIEEGGLQPVDVNKIAAEAVQVIRPRWKDESEAKGILIEVGTHLGDIPFIRGAQSGLHDIFINLILNALDAMPKGGIISVCTQAERRLI